MVQYRRNSSTGDQSKRAMSTTATRLITLILLLQRRPNQKASELAEALHVSARTIQRYIAMLDQMGSSGVQGKGGAAG